MQKLSAILLGIAAAALVVITPAAAQFKQPTKSPMLVGLDEFHAGQYPQALQHFVLQLKAHPEDIQARYCCGVTLHYMGRLPEATREYEYVAKSAADPALVRRAKKGLSGCASGVSPTGATYTAIGSAPDADSGQGYGGGGGAGSGAIANAMGAPGGIEGVDADMFGSVNMPHGGGVMQRAARGTGYQFGSGGGSGTMTASPEPRAVGANTSLSGRVIEFTADWCGWCKKYQPVLDQAREKYGTGVTFEQFDADKAEGKELMQKYQVHGLPNTLIFNSAGALVAQIPGYVPFEKLEETLQEKLAQ